MKTDAIFYEIFKELPNIFFELIGRSNINSNAYVFSAPEIKQTSLRLDGLFSTREDFINEPLYFVEIQFYKDEDFYDSFMTDCLQVFFCILVNINLLTQTDTQLLFTIAAAMKLHFPRVIALY